MMVTNHVLAGAVIGTVAPGPLSSFTAGVASHFAMDALPHWGGEVTPEEFWKVAVRDGLTGLAVMVAVTTATPPGDRLRVFAGMAGAAFPDLNKPYRMVFGRSPFPAPVEKLHRFVQREARHRLPHELAAGAGLVAGAGLAAYRLRNRRRSCR